MAEFARLFLSVFMSIDEMIGRWAQALFSRLEERGFSAPVILRAASLAILSGVVVFLAAAVACPPANRLDYGLILISCFLVGFVESRWARIHHTNAQKPWSPLLAQLYFEAAVRSRHFLLPVRMIPVFYVPLVGVYGLFQAQGTLVDLLSYFVLVVYGVKLYLERSMPGTSRPTSSKTFQYNGSKGSAT